jgi:hypothetical protein
LVIARLIRNQTRKSLGSLQNRRTDDDQVSIPGVAALALMMLAPDATAQVVSGAARGGVRGAMVGGR